MPLFSARPSRRFIALIALAAAITSILVALMAPALSREAYMWSTLYLGSAIVSAIGAVVAIPFAIWVLYMQSRFGAMVVRLFLSKILLPFAILVLSIAVTAVAMVAAFAKQMYIYVSAYATLIVEAAVFVPMIAIYVLRLMTLRPTEVVETVARNTQNIDETVTALLRLATTYLMESPIEESAVTVAIRRVISVLTRGKTMERNPPSPTTWHAMRSFLMTLVRENVPLPSRRLVGNLMSVFMAWLLMHGKDRAARMLMRHYRRVARRYLDIRMPSEIVNELVLEPIIERIEAMRTQIKEELRLYAYEQLYSFLTSIRIMVLRGEIPARELCATTSIVEKRLERAEGIGPDMVREYIAKLRREFHCQQKYVRKKRTVIQQTSESIKAGEKQASLGEEASHLSSEDQEASSVSSSGLTPSSSPTS